MVVVVVVVVVVEDDGVVDGATVSSKVRRGGRCQVSCRSARAFSRAGSLQQPDRLQ